MAVLRTIVWFIYFFGKLISIIPAMLKAQKLQKMGDKEGVSALIDKNAVVWARTLMRIAGARVTVTGLENIPKNRAVVFTPNHQSDYDIPLMLVYLPRPYPLLAKIETLKIPLVSSWMRLMGCVFIDRKNPRKAMEALHETESLVKSGECVVVFPEGTRSKSDAMGEFKPGAFKIATKTGAPIVPIAISGSYKIMEANHNLMCPADVTLKFLPAIETSGLDRATQKELPEQVAALIAAANKET